MRTTASVMQGPPVQARSDDSLVRPAIMEDFDDCNQVCIAVHGHDRGEELKQAIDQGAALVVERSGGIKGYSTGVNFFGHSVGETNNDLKALIASVPSFMGPGFLVPNTNGDLLRWCYANGLHMVKAMTLMSVGLYNEPQGAYLPSVLY